MAMSKHIISNSNRPAMEPIHNPTNLKQFTVCSKTTSLKHFQMYSLKALSLLSRVDVEWELTARSEFSCKYYWDARKVRTIFTCYELLIVEFNQYCEVLELPDLGKCMMKMFVQIMAIVESLFRCGFAFEGVEATEMAASKTEMRKNEKEKSPNSGLKQQKQKTFKGLSRSYFAEKQKQKYEAKQVQNQLEKMQRSIEAEKQANLLNEQKMRQAKIKALSIQPSNVELMISEACILMENKYSFFNDLILLRNNKLKIQEAKDLQRSSSIIFNESLSKSSETYKQAVKKLIEIVQKHHLQKEKQRKSKLVQSQSQTVEVPPPPPSVLSKSDKQKLSRKEQQIKNLRQELKSEKTRAMVLQKMLKDKSQSFEKQLMKQRGKLARLEQRVSIVTRFPNKQSQFNIDSVNSEHTVNKEPAEPSQLRISYDNIRSQVLKKNSERKISKISLPDRKMQRSSCDFGQINSRFAGQKNKKVKLTIQPHLFQIIINPINPVTPQHLEIQLVTKLKSDVSVQTDFKVKQLKNAADKKVTFKKQLNHVFQFNLVLSNGYAKHTAFREPASIAQDVSNYSGPSLKKKRGVAVNWSKNKGYRTFSSIIEEEEEEPRTKRIFENVQEKNKENIQDLYIGDRQRAEIQQLKWKIKIKVPEISVYNFGQTDLNVLFKGVEKALDLQFLNYNVGSSRNKFDTCEILRSQKYLLMNKSSEKRKRCQSSIGGRRSSSHLVASMGSYRMNQFMVQALFKYLKVIKYSNAAKYEKIRNFLRYPHSSVYKSQEQKWISLSKEEDDIELPELRKIYLRVEKIHEGCEKMGQLQMCAHVMEFFNKIGLSFVDEESSFH